MPDSSLDAIFKAYDVRGVVPDEFNADIARHIGAAAARVLDGETIVVGRDVRPSSPDLVSAFTEGVISQGVDVVHVGLSSTDMLYFSSGVLDVPGAMFTASHNPPQYNGIKLCRAGAVPVSIDSGLGDIRDLVASDELEPGGSQGDEREEDMLSRYAEHVRSFINLDVLGPLTVVIDAANGMAGHVVPAVFEGLPFELVPLYFELDGTFPNHPPDPSNDENLTDLSAAVREHQADLGLAFDGDADRMFAVNEHGDPVRPSLIAAVVAARVLEKEPGATILYNLICSRVVPETVRDHGGEAIRTRVGHSFVKQRMAETGAAFGAEHSGHYYFRENYRADSGLVAALILLEAVSLADAPLSQVVAPFDRYVQSGEVNFEVDDQEAVLERVEDEFRGRGELDRTDGLTVELDGAWFNLRPSNTEPVIRLNVEAEEEDEMTRLRDEVAELVKSG